MIFNVTGGGGAALNFKVLAYPDEATLLAAIPAENTIGIITTTPITSWIFSAEEPSPATAGEVWFSVGIASKVAFSATKKNPVMVYPLSAKQYISGVWADVTAKSYQSGNWEPWWTGLLYKNGDEQASVTGGWQARGLKITGSANSATAPTLVKNTASMSASLAQDGSHGNGGVVEIVNDVDLTEYKKLVVSFVKIEKASNNLLGIIVYDRKISITGSDYTAPWSNTKASLNVTANSTATIEYSVDIASINEPACVGIALYNAATPADIICEITKVELVK